MPFVVLILKDLGPQKREAMAVLRDGLGIAFSDIGQAVSGGVPLLRRPLFDRKTPDFPRALLEAISKLEKLQTSFSVFELLDSQSYSVGERYYEITSERLANMIAAREQSLEQQRRLGELQEKESESD